MMGIKYQIKNKVLFISSEFPPGPGGIGTHAYSVSNELQKRGYQIIINTKSDYVGTNQEVSFDLRHSYKIYRFKRWKSTILTWIHRLKTIRYTINKYRIKNVIISGESSIWVIPFIKFYKGMNILTVIHGTELGKRIFLKWTLFCLEKSNNIIAVSNFTRSLIPEKLKLKTYVINNGVDIYKWNNIAESYVLDNYPILITIGSISLRKGQYNVIKSLPEILKVFPNTHYHCIGNYKDKEQLLSFIKKLKLDEAVTIHGFLEHSELEKIYSMAHVNMLLSNNNNNTDFEGYGISVLEGNIYGIPAIGAKDSGLEDAIKNYYNGELVNPNNSKEIMASLKNILKDYDNYSTRSKSYANNNKWDSKIDQYEKLI